MNQNNGFEGRYWGDMQAEMTTAPAYGTMRGGPRQSMQQGTVQDMQQGMSPEVLTQVLFLIVGALRQETDIRFYFGYLLTMAPSAEDVEVLTAIRQIVIKNLEMLRRLYIELAGANPPVVEEAPFVRPLTYCEGLATVLLRVQDAVAVYRNILFNVQQRRHIDTMAEFLTDEIGNLGRLNYLYAKNECNV
jgi:hypothetical protein